MFMLAGCDKGCNSDKKLIESYVESINETSKQSSNEETNMAETVSNSENTSQEATTSMPAEETTLVDDTTINDDFTVENVEEFTTGVDNSATIDPFAPTLDHVNIFMDENEEGIIDPFIVAAVLLQANVEFSDIYIYRGVGINDENLIAIQTGQKDVDVIYNPESEEDGTMWCKFGGHVYWFDDTSNIPSDEDMVTITVTGFIDGQETATSNAITATWGELIVE